MYIFISEFQGSRLLLACNINSESSNNTSNIFFFSDENPANNEGSNSNNSSNNNPDNSEYSTNSNDNQENNEGSNSNLNEENNEGTNSNSMGDSNSDHNDPENNDSEEINDPEHNAPERIVDDLDIVDKAKNNDPEALEYLSREYGHFFDDTSKDKALEDIQEYLEGEFPKELERSEFEADALQAIENAEDIEKQVSELEKESEETTDPQIKENISKSIDILKDKAAEERENAEKAEFAAKSYGKDSSEEDEPYYSDGNGTCYEEDEKDNKPKRPISEEEEEKQIKRQKSNNDGEDGNNSSGGTGPSTPSGPSDPGPSSSSGGGGNLSKILIILGGLFETLSQVIENFMNIM